MLHLQYLQGLVLVTVMRGVGGPPGGPEASVQGSVRFAPNLEWNGELLEGYGWVTEVGESSIAFVVAEGVCWWHVCIVVGRRD